MRDDSYLDAEVEAEEATSKWRARTATAVGALLSIAILIAVVIWSYRLGVRDAAEIPVIRAELGATKEKPEEPGGLEVDYQDRAVYGVLTGDAETTGPAAYAEASDGLSEEDLAPVQRAPAPAPRPADEAAVATAEAPAQPAPDPAPASPAPIAAPSPTGEAAASDGIAAAERTAGGEEPAAPGAEAIPPFNGDAEAATPGIAEESRLAPAAAPVARPRPARRTATRTTPEPQPDAEPRAAALASRIQIQLGAFVSQEVAEEQWAAIRARNGDLLAGRGRVITPVLSGGRRLFRLRAGPFENVTEAAALCRGMKARNEACIVARREN